MRHDPDDLLADIDRLLVAEREALLSGRLESLPDLLQRKEALIDRLPSLEGAMDPRALRNLRGQAVRNQELMNNAMRGIRAVATRLGTMRRLRRSLDTYDQAGRRTTIVTPGGSQVEKRA